MLYISFNFGVLKISYDKTGVGREKSRLAAHPLLEGLRLTVRVEGSDSEGPAAGGPGLLGAPQNRKRASCSQ